MEELYTLEKEVGRGSYGVVFEGQMSKTGQRVAIKRLPCSNPECIELYLQELWAMRATAKNHPNVIALYNCLLQTGTRNLKPLKPGKLPLSLVESVLKGKVVGAKNQEQSTTPQSGNKRTKSSASKLQDRTNMAQAKSKSDALTPQRPQKRTRKRSAPEEDTPNVPLKCLALWLVMEYCDGGDLNQYLLSKPPDEEKNHSIVLQLCSAMAFLHGLGITHRDLKPANVLVCETDKGPVVKVADFGLSKMAEGSLAGDICRQHFSSTCGSDFYMAPEVWGGQSYTAQADIFSLGVMFWAVLERLTFLEEGTTEEQLGAYACKGRWLMPLGEALSENPDFPLCIPMKFRRAPPLPPVPGPSICALLLDMLAVDPFSRPRADQLESRVRQALRQDAHCA